MTRPIIIMKYYGSYPNGVKTYPALDINGGKFPIEKMEKVPNGLLVTMTLYSGRYDIIVEEEEDG